MRFKHMIWMVLACVTLWCGIAPAETVDRIVAVVNGDAILFSDLQKQMNVMEKLRPELKTEDPARQAQIQREVLQQIIEQRLVEKEIERLKISVSPADVDNAIRGIKQQYNYTDAQLEYFINLEGQTLDQFREKIKKDLERNRLLDRVVKSKTIITDQQVDAHLKTGKSSVQEERRIAVLFLKSEGHAGAEDVEKKAREIRDRLKKGADFTRMVKEVSQGPAVEQGGDIGFLSIEELAPPIEQATRGLRPDEISEVVKTTGGCYILKLLEVRRQSTDVGDPAVKEKARRQLFQEELSRKFEIWLKELQDKAYIQVFL